MGSRGWKGLKDLVPMQHTQTREVGVEYQRFIQIVYILAEWFP
jgi:hypothetical protein